MLPAPTSVFDFERPIVAAAEEFGQGAAPAAEAALVQLPLQRGAERGQVELHAAVDDPAPALEHGRERHEHVEDPPQAPHLVAGRHHARVYMNYRRIAPFVFRLHTFLAVRTSDGFHTFMFRGSIPMFGFPKLTGDPQCPAPFSGCRHVMGSHLHRQDYCRPHAWRPCGTGARRPRFVCRGQPKAAIVPPCIAPCARREATGGGPAGCLADLGARGHGFFSWRFSPAMCRSFRNQ